MSQLPDSSLHPRYDEIPTITHLFQESMNLARLVESPELADTIIVASRLESTLFKVGFC
jgi:hypothetical protein